MYRFIVQYNILRSNLYYNYLWKGLFIIFTKCVGCRWTINHDALRTQIVSTYVDSIVFNAISVFVCWTKIAIKFKNLI